MKGRSSKPGVDRRFKQEPHLSGAYIRSLVRQLVSARCTKDPESVDGFGGRNLTEFGDGFSEPAQSHGQQPEPPPPQQHRKQVRNRRRVHTSRPYQERLINMAEARREIVTALKFHRAAMKQANEQQQQQQQLSHHSESNTNNLSTYTWPALNCSLPSQNLDFHHNRKNPSIHSSPSSSSSSTLSVAAPHEVGHGTGADSTEFYGGGCLHQAVDDEGMAEMKSLGEQHQMEWNDTMNLVTSARWFKFLNEFDQAMEFPAWLNANDSVMGQHLDDLVPDTYIQGSALPCMDIGEIDGDWHWLA
ncbi:hypothetical protein F3Y22_tig00110940pilonHSYRG00060 [Hibiscus syriacus]|uniref:Uncharacterized protein n=1 Tax=Hibiscus syriacus TaxID=106335 RepID=A0A6A2ZBP3_HIBSY|nr:uncharacterized protein LOC120147460 [Hibiscus syriacus]KAE8689167.1 hypothetical protein F3Y22_tig00110940pilonHSYRG00060 [Hibiscus syriacus]